MFFGCPGFKTSKFLQLNYVYRGAVFFFLVIIVDWHRGGRGRAERGTYLRHNVVCCIVSNVHDLRLIYTERKRIFFFDLCRCSMWTFKLNFLWTHLEMMSLLQQYKRSLTLSKRNFALKIIRVCSQYFINECDFAESREEKSIKKANVNLFGNELLLTAQFSKWGIFNLT